MSTITALETIQTFLMEKVTPTIKLQKANDNNVLEYTLVSPQTHVGWIPPKGYLPEGMEAAIPCLIVGLDEAADDDQDEELNIRISAAVYSPGKHTPKEPSGTNYTPDFQGYQDLLNLIDRTKNALKKTKIIDFKLSINSPVRWGMYQEQPYPYWYGWITFSVRRASYPQSELINELLY